MACGSMLATENQLARDLKTIELTRNDLSSEITLQNRESPSVSRSISFRNGSSVHEAIRFLQAEHEAVLQGLHQQIQLLQQRCDDLQFEAHLRHVTQTDEEIWETQVCDLTKQLQEKTSHVLQLKEELSVQKKLTQEEQEQHRWRELQLQQQVETGEQRVADLRAEVSRLRAQVRDLRVYSSALRTVGSRAPSTRSTRPTTSVTSARSHSRASQFSVGSLDSLEFGGPQSLGSSEDGEAGSWRGSRLGGIIGATQRHHPRTSRGLQSPTARRSTFSLPPTLHSPLESLPPLTSLPQERPSSSSVVLPPIATTQSVSRHVRRQLRLGSAPVLDIERKDA